MTEKELLTALLQAFYRDRFSGDLYYLYLEHIPLKEILGTEEYTKLLDWMTTNKVSGGLVE